jgi:hypothetical protein
LRLFGEVVTGQMSCSHRRPVETQQATALQDAIDDGFSQVFIVQYASPLLRMLVRREEHRLASNVAVVDHVVEHVRSVVAVSEVSHFIDNQNVGADECVDRSAHAAIPACV